MHTLVSASVAWGVQGQPHTLPSKHRVPEHKSGSLTSLSGSREGAVAAPPGAAGNGLAPLAARASDSGFPSGPFPLSGCFALNPQSSAFSSPPCPPLPPLQSGAGRIPDISGPAGAPTPTPTRTPRPPGPTAGKGRPTRRPDRPLLPKAGSAAPRSWRRCGARAGSAGGCRAAADAGEVRGRREDDRVAAPAVY